MDLKDSPVLLAVVCGTLPPPPGNPTDATGFADPRNARIDGSSEHQTPNAAGERWLGQVPRFRGMVKMTVMLQRQSMDELV